MYKNSAIVLLKKTEESKYLYKITDNNNNLPLFKFLFRVLDWTQNDELDTSDDNSFNLQIIIYPPSNIINEGLPQKIVPFGQKDLTGEIKTPILHVVLTDILSHNNKLHPSVPRYFQIIDSSIWNHYVPLVNNKNQIDVFNALFTKAVDDIFENNQKGLYELEVAKEFADVSARILHQSYLSGDHATGVAPFMFHSETAIKELINKEFKELKAKKKVREDGNEYVFWPWRFRMLLVDDKAIDKEEDGTMKKNCKLSIIMRLIEKELEFPKEKNWIQYRFLEQTDGKLNILEGSIDDNARIVIECVQKYDNAILALKTKKYDLILLDYLLDLKDEQRKYGYELLEEINRSMKIKKQFERFCYPIDYSTCEEKVKAIRELISTKAESNKTENYELRKFINTIKVDNKDITQGFITKDNIEKLLEIIQTEIDNEQFIIGSNRKMFFIFISAYPTAVNERLLAQGLNRSEDFWHINIGACPTNTPQLFTYNLLHMMNKRLKGCGIHKLSGDKILEQVEKIFKPENKKTDKNNSVRKRAGKHYHEVLSLQYHYHRMLDDVEIPHNCNKTQESIFDIKGSVLISYYSFLNQHIGGILEHLVNLIHIAAFGTIRQWDEMWEEYLYFKAKFGTIISQNDESIATNYKKVCGYIENFILVLKSQQR